MHFKTLGVALLISAGAFIVPAHAASLEAFSGVVAGLNTCDGGGPPAGMYAFFGDLGFGIGSTAGGSNGISDCGLAGGISDVFQNVGTAHSNVVPLVNAGFGSYPATYSGTAAASATYGTVGASITGAMSGPVNANGVAESAAYGIASDTWNIGGGSGTGYAMLSFQLGAEGSLTTPVSGGLQSEVEVQLGAGAPERVNQTDRVDQFRSIARHSITSPSIARSLPPRSLKIPLRSP